MAERHGGQGRKGLALWERQAWCAWMPKMGEGSDIHGSGDGRERQGGRAGGDVRGQARLSLSEHSSLPSHSGLLGSSLQSHWPSRGFSEPALCPVPLALGGNPRLVTDWDLCALLPAIHLWWEGVSTEQRDRCLVPRQQRY